MQRSRDSRRHQVTPIQLLTYLEWLTIHYARSRSARVLHLIEQRATVDVPSDLARLWARSRLLAREFERKRKWMETSAAGKKVLKTAEAPPGSAQETDAVLAGIDEGKLVVIGKEEVSRPTDPGKDEQQPTVALAPLWEERQRRLARDRVSKSLAVGARLHSNCLKLTETVLVQPWRHGSPHCKARHPARRGSSRQGDISG